MEDILDAFGLKYEKLSLDEKETLEGWATALEAGQNMSLEDVKDEIQKCMREVMLKLTEEKEGTVNNIFLKARLQNYILLEAFLLGPLQARKELEAYVQKMKEDRR